jgi:hypothetical protein
LFGGINSSTSTTQKTEWRIEYKCKGGDAAPDAPASSDNAKKSGAIHTLIIRY